VLHSGPLRHRNSAPTAARGVLLLGLLLGLALAGLMLMLALDVWALERQRQREQELLFVGDQYRAAIQRYFYAAPKGTPRVFPATLQDLQQDDRYPIPVRHLRRLYPDPLTGEPRWGAVMQGSRITGVYSLGKGTPLKVAGFGKSDEGFNGRSSYRDWAFVFVPPIHAPPGRAARAAPADAIGVPTTTP
jgi:type II secretory pathway pseudopilin PulG